MKYQKQQKCLFYIIETLLSGNDFIFLFCIFINQRHKLFRDIIIPQTTKVAMSKVNGIYGVILKIFKFSEIAAGLRNNFEIFILKATNKATTGWNKMEVN